MLSDIHGGRAKGNLGRGGFLDFCNFLFSVVRMFGLVFFGFVTDGPSKAIQHSHFVNRYINNKNLDLKTRLLSFTHRLD